MTQPRMAWHAIPVTEVASLLNSDLSAGLDPLDAAGRLKQYGRNTFPEAKKKTLLGMFFDQFKDLLVLILVAAAGISLVVGLTSPEEGITDALVIMAILVLNAVLGVSQERKADRALESIKKMAVPCCEVVRGGRIEEVSSEEIVPGDIVILREGDFVSTDLRLTEAPNLRIDEASLTGESVAVEKRLGEVGEDIPLAERSNMAYAGTHVVYGRGRGMAVATGMTREIGRIAAMLQQAEPEPTPLQRSLAGLGKLLGIGALAICTLVFIVGILKGEGIMNMFMTAVSLAVAAIPEGLPAIVTIVLALGVHRMSRHHAIIRKLPAVETLGCASYICSDKTGTLTQNRMTVLQTLTAEELFGGRQTLSPQASRTLLEVAILCNDAHIQRGGGEEQRFGDPTELAFVDYAEKQGLSVSELRDHGQRIAELPFDAQRKMMSTLNFVADRRRILVKGAPGNVIEHCTSYELDGQLRPMGQKEREQAVTAMEHLAAQALRVLAFAWKHGEGKEVVAAEDENELVFAGLMGLMDPPRVEVKAAIQEARQAGIHTIMITGDNVLTAKAVAADIGLFEPGDEAMTGQELAKIPEEELIARIRSLRVFARVWPEQKMKIVSALQQKGEVVAMTGDGVNDAPAIKKADIGVAMGITGTEVAKETSDMVLTDDNFATIVQAIKEGRVIFDNIHKFVMYLLACNVGEIFSIFVPIIMGLGSPLRPVQILLVNLVTDGVVALSLGVAPRSRTS